MTRVPYQLKRFASMILLAGTLASPAYAKTSTVTEPAVDSVPASQLNDNINEVINRPEFSWRLPREAIETDNEHGFLSAFLDEVGELMKKFGRLMEKTLRKLGKWIESWFKDDYDFRKPDTGAFNWEAIPRLLIVVLLVVIACVGGVALYRMFKKHRRIKKDPDAGLLFAPPDLEEDDITADQLETSAWMELAHDLLAKGEQRLAARAMFLAGLAHLAEQHLISIARFKSNREYKRELTRKAHDRTHLLNDFSSSMYFFESIWYGLHTITPQKLNTYTEEIERILNER